MNHDATDPETETRGDRRAAWREEAQSLHEEARALRGELSAINASLLRMESVMQTHLAENAKVLPILEDLVALRRGSQIVLPILIKIVAGLTTVVGLLWAGAVWMRDHVRW